MKNQAAFVARQPILDRNQRMIGYELLFRKTRGSTSFDLVDGNVATSHVIAQSILTIGLEKLLAGGRAFLNFPRELLLSDLAFVLPPETTVVEVLESVVCDEAVIEACRRLKARGYTIALDDFVPGSGLEPLVGLADIVKVDFQLSTPAEQRHLAAQFRYKPILLLAEKVETLGDFRYAHSLGYSYFQGYYFAHPAIVQGLQPPAFHGHYLELLRVINSEDTEVAELERIVRQELSLVYTLLRFVNSARFAWAGEIQSIRHAFVLLGREEMRKWALLAIMCVAAEKKPRELVVMAMVRARFCESLAAIGAPESQSMLFLVGLLSLADVILGRPLGQVLGEMRSSHDVSRILLDADRKWIPASLYGLGLAYEAGDWETVAVLASQCSIAQESLPPLYLAAVEWSHDIFESPKTSLPVGSHGIIHER